MRHTHLGIALHFVDRLVCSGVPLEQVAQDLQSYLEVVFAWWKTTAQVSAGHVYVRFINGDPHVAMAPQSFHHPAGESGKKLDRGFVLPTSHFHQPQRIGKVMQRDHRHHVAFFEPKQHLAVAVKRAFIPAVWLGLDARPFHGKAVRVLISFVGAVKILTPAPCPPVCSSTGPVAVQNMAFLLLPGPPVVVQVVAFHLVRSSGSAPQESTGKCKGSSRHDRLHVVFR